MSTVQEFDAIEFFTLWDDARLGMLPAPFYFSTDIESEAEFEAETARARERLACRTGPPLDQFLTALARPDIGIVLTGWDSADPMRAGGLVRVLGVRRGAAGYVIEQRPGRTFFHSGGFTVTGCDAVRLAEVVAGALPAERAGSLPETPLPAGVEADVDYSFGRSAVHDSFDDPPEERARHFLNLPTTRTGTIEIVQGRSVFGPRGLTRHLLEWRDVLGDGRYLVDDRTPPVAVGTGPEQLTALINTRIAAVVRAIKDEPVPR
ncbi:ESX secretion-associated protein EspG [Nocardia sp. NPDC050697]|uniref:ESX secretion-associated protein EspG n=1 Tax=Nocardia sp. NPDC050697 TaxID=3155158 RepID=UPI0033CE3D9C